MTYSCASLHTDKQRQYDQLEPTYNSSVTIQDVDLKVYWERWTIESGSGIGSGGSMLMAWHDDDDTYLTALILICGLLWLLYIYISLNQRFIIEIFCTGIHGNSILVHILLIICELILRDWNVVDTRENNTDKIQVNLHFPWRHRDFKKLVLL